MVSGGGTFVRRLRDCRKILIPYGDTERPMKPVKSLLGVRVHRPIKILPQRAKMPNRSERQAKGGHKGHRGSMKFSVRT